MGVIGGHAPVDVYFVTGFLTLFCHKSIKRFNENMPSNAKLRTGKVLKTEESDGRKTSDKNAIEDPDDKKSLPGDKFGPLGIKKRDQLCSRAVLMTGVLIIVIVTKWRKSDVITWASQNEKLTKAKGQPLICSQTFFDEINSYPKCAIKQCGRFVVDGLIDEDEIDTLITIFKKGLKYGGSSGGASILDLHSGALSKGQNFINVFTNNPDGRNLWNQAELAAYTRAKEKIKKAIESEFHLKPDTIYLTSPTFFSEMTAEPAKTIHDEYWHPHVDKETYEAFHFTSLLYLSDYDSEFQGGRFIFMDGDRLNRTIEPRRGRISMFTSGGENLHYVEKVTSGRRYALTIAFTCDSKKGIADLSSQEPI